MIFFPHFVGAQNNSTNIQKKKKHTYEIKAGGDFYIAQTVASHSLLHSV